MPAKQTDPKLEWERERFLKETALREQELSISHKRLRAEIVRNVIIGALVPITLATMTALPSYLSAKSERALQKAKLESELIVQSVRTGDPDQAATNLAFLVDTGLIAGQTGQLIQRYLKRRQPGTGRALPVN